VITASVIITTVAVICLLTSNVVSSLIFREALRDMSRDRALSDERRDAQMSAMLDRFQAIKWEDLVAVRAYESAEQVGGFLTPAEQAAEAVTEIDEQMKWGPLSRLQAVREQEEAEQALLAEDFPDDYPARQETETPA
jgi:hypothetical protein